MDKMAQISTTKTSSQKPVQKKDRFWGALWAGSKTMAVSFAKTGYALWLEVTGLLCGLVAFRYISALIHEYQVHHFDDRKRFWTFAIFAAVFSWFTVLSFVKARRMKK
jgi:hypothetical protein